MRAVVTGNRGFIGRHMSAELRRRNFSVIGYDIADGRSALDLFNDAYWSRPDLIVHCAAVEPFRSAIDTKPELMVSNIILDAALFRWVMRSSPSELRNMRIVYLSSSAAYPIEHQNLSTGSPLHEDLISADHIERSDADYGWVKITGEHMASNARKLGAQVTVVRPFSGYAADQSDNHPFGAFLARARRNDDPFELWGDGQQLRDWIHVEDIVKAILAVADADPTGSAGPVNICTGIGTSMVNLASMLCAEAGYKPDFYLRPEMPSGVMYRVGDPERLKNFYRPTISLEEGIRRAVAA